MKGPKAMIENLTATVVEEGLQLDAPLELPEESRVRVIVEPLLKTNEKWGAALQGLRDLQQNRPFGSGENRYTRDELHERR